jgi:hypothetical protein
MENNRSIRDALGSLKPGALFFHFHGATFSGVAGDPGWRTWISCG